MRRALIACAVACAAPAEAIVITEAAWRANGGAEEKWDEGFSAHEARAAEPQFRAMVSLSMNGGGEYGAASGVWLGNADGKAYVLTAAHVFGEGSKPGEYRARTAGGTVRAGLRSFSHPAWDDDIDGSGGFDFAILELNGPIEDAGEPPILYRGRDELGRTGVIVGYGTRGVAPYGHGYRFGPRHGDRAAAAENVVDRIRGAANGDTLTIDLDEPDGPGKNRTGDVAPISMLEGILAPGDSGGSLWMQFDGEWRLVGVNSSGDPGADYQDLSNFARIATQIAWIKSIFPAARVGGNKGERAAR
jgi:hypothetical protein